MDMDEIAEEKVVEDVEDKEFWDELMLDDDVIMYVSEEFEEDVALAKG